MIKLEEEKDKRIEEQTKQWLETEEKRERDRIEREEKHEERMFMMFSTFMGQMMQMIPHTGSHMYRDSTSSLWDYGSSSYYNSNNASYPATSQAVPRFSSCSEMPESDAHDSIM